MTNKLLVLADLGHVKAYQLDENPAFGTPRLTLMEDWETNVSDHLSEELTDQFGRYRRSSSEFSDGEEHNLELERRRRAARTIAKRIDKLTKKAEACYFAAPREINQAVIDEMDQSTRAKIEKNVAADLTKVTDDQIIKHFCA